MAGVHIHIHREEPTSKKKMKKTISYSEKHPFKSVSCCRFPFLYSEKSRIGSENVVRNKAFILADLMHNHIVIVENTHIQFSYKVIKIMCLRVLSDDNTLVHKICKYKYFHPWYILWAYSIYHQNNEKNNKNDQLIWTGPFHKNL